MMIYSKYCIDPTAGFDIVDGIQRPRKLGFMVDTVEESEAKLSKRKLPGGDLDPERLSVLADKLYHELDLINGRIV